MRPTLLYGEYELTIDDKNRLLVPSEVRKRLDPERDGEAFFLVTGADRVLCLFPERYYEYLASQPVPEMIPDSDVLAFDRLNFALASRLEWDKQGRVLVPDKAMRRTNLQKDVTLVGVRDHLELWNRADWEAHRAALESRSSEIALRAKQIRQTPPTDG